MVGSFEIIGLLEQFVSFEAVRSFALIRSFEIIGSLEQIGSFEANRSFGPIGSFGVIGSYEIIGSGDFVVNNSRVKLSHIAKYTM